MKTVKTATLALLSLAVATACAPDEPPSGGNTEQTTVASADYDTGKYKTTLGRLLHDTDESNMRDIESRVHIRICALTF